MIELPKYERRVADAADDLKRAESDWREAEAHMNHAANHLAHCEQELEEYLTAHGNNPDTLLPEGCTVLESDAAVVVVFDDCLIRVAPQMDPHEDGPKWLMVIHTMAAGLVLQQWTAERHKKWQAAVREAMVKGGLV